MGTEYVVYGVLLPVPAYAAALVREAGHGWYRVPHVPCPGNGAVVCDQGWASAVGLEAATARVIADHVSDADPWAEQWRDDALDAAADAAEKVIE